MTLEELVFKQQEEIVMLRDELRQLADEMVYRGNSVSWIYSKAENYKNAIMLTFKEVDNSDGNTPIWECVRAIREERDKLRLVVAGGCR